eukprot:3700000-Pyramimonas_sp.AAC.1
MSVQVRFQPGGRVTHPYFCGVAGVPVGHLGQSGGPHAAMAAGEALLAIQVRPSAAHWAVAAQAGVADRERRLWTQAALLILKEGGRGGHRCSSEKTAGKSEGRNGQKSEGCNGRDLSVGTGTLIFQTQKQLPRRWVALTRATTMLHKGGN